MAIKTYKKGSTEKLSANFRVSEFACKGKNCCTEVLIDGQLVIYLQQIRDHFGKAVTITSAYRCAKHNKNVKGATGSRHVKGMAADIKVKGVAPAEVAKFAESIGVLGIGLYETDKDGHFVHIDTRTTKSFWYGQAQAKRTTFGGTVQQTCTVELPVLAKGAEGDSVKALQHLLIAAGESCGTAGADGDFGTATDKALRGFQSKHKLIEDGKAGADTWACLLGVE